ncbi:hypothetical protein AVO41_01230 [Thiomicrospira sp. WB1]|nr:hypothetical protein AVO41_01230 [Thiomicrospira sp. WB1]
MIGPLLMLGVYTLVFNGFFRLRWPGGESLGTLGFALHVYIGFIVFSFFSDLITKSPSLILNQSNLVTKVVFPLKVIPLTSVLASGFTLMVMMAILFLFAGLIHQVHLTWLLTPLVVGSLVMLVLGLVFWFSALGVYLRDLKQANALVASLFMFLSPVFYPVSAVPERWQDVYMLNPLAQHMEMLRDLVVYGEMLSLKAFGLTALVSLLVLMSGVWVFDKLRRGFADVL